MIKIRYRDPRELAPGLYAAAECHRRGTTVYLLPGLSVAQRRAALRRLRISARRGCGPRLPAPQLAVALLAHRVRTAAGRAGAVFRSHPAASTVPVMVVSAGAIAFLALSAVSIRVIQPPRGSSQPSFAGVAAAGLPASAGAPGGRPRYAGRADPGQAGQAGAQPAAGSRPGAQRDGRVRDRRVRDRRVRDRRERWHSHGLHPGPGLQPEFRRRNDPGRGRRLDARAGCDGVQHRARGGVQHCARARPAGQLIADAERQPERDVPGRGAAGALPVAGPVAGPAAGAGRPGRPLT